VFPRPAKVGGNAKLGDVVQPTSPSLHHDSFLVRLRFLHLRKTRASCFGSGPLLRKAAPRRGNQRRGAWVTVQ
jgi:hypothetical protein